MHILDLKWGERLWQTVFSRNCYSNQTRDLIPHALLESYSPSGDEVNFLAPLTKADLCYCFNK